MKKVFQIDLTEDDIDEDNDNKDIDINNNNENNISIKPNDLINNNNI